MLPDRVSNPGPLTYESGALPIALRGSAPSGTNGKLMVSGVRILKHFRVYKSRNKTKPTMWHDCPAETQNSLGSLLKDFVVSMEETLSYSLSALQTL